MAFSLFFEDGAEIDFQVHSNRSEFIVTVQLGYDDLNDVTYSLMVCLSPPAGAVDGEYELIFCVIEYDHEEECEYQLWDGLETRRKIIEPEHRSACLWALKCALRILIDEAAPKIVSMFTHSTNMPAKALRKYNIAASVFSDAGFTVGQSDPYNGREIWLMERVS